MYLSGFLIWISDLARTTDTRWLNPKFFAAQIQIQIPIPNAYFGCGYKDLINGKHGKGTHSTKIGAENRSKVLQMPQKLSAQFFCPSPKV